MRALFRTRRWVAGTIAGVIGVPWLTWLACPERKLTAVCTVCGETDVRAERLLPFTDFPVWRRHTHLATAVSGALSRHGVRAGHAHQYVLALTQVSSPGLSVARGPRCGVLGVARTPEIGVFVENLVKYADPATVDLWLARLLDPVYGEFVANVVLEAPLWWRAYDDAEQFRARWEHGGSALLERQLRDAMEASSHDS